MSNMITTEECLETFGRRSALLLLILLLCGDLAFIFLHFIQAMIPALKNPLLNISTDGGYGEMYQYIKFFWIIILLIFVSRKNASRHYVAWILVFVYFLLDDSLQVHERIGHYLASKLSFVPPFGLRLQDLGELAVYGTAGIILLIPLVWAYKNGSRMFRKVTHDLGLLTLILIFFAVGMDMVEEIIKLGPVVQSVLGVIEDGGEMLSVSFILWYVFLLTETNLDSGCYLCDCVRLFLTRRSTLS